MKQMAIEGALQNNRASQTSSLALALQLGSAKVGVAWMEEGLAALRAESRLRFRKPCVVSLAFDASQMGKPAKEVLVISQYMYPADASVVLPPQDRLEFLRLHPRAWKLHLRSTK